MIKVAIAGVGNCCSSLVQAVALAKQGLLDTGIIHPVIGGYKIEDISFSLAFDVDKKKIGKDLSSAIFSAPNCTTQYGSVPLQNAPVKPGILLDGVADHLSEIVEVDPQTKHTTVKEISSLLSNAEVDVLVCYLPVGALRATEAYAEAAAAAKVAFINCNPTRIATSEKYAALFVDAGVPLLGDDVKSQIGSTSIHRVILELLKKKGVRVSKTYQLNIGGNTDFLNMRDPSRAASKKYTKEIALTHLFNEGEIPELGVGPSDYVPQLRDNKVGYIHIEGEGLMGMPFSIELQLKVEDSPNSAGVVLEAIRAAKTALDRELSGPIPDACSFLFKNPPNQLVEDEASKILDQFALQEMTHVKECLTKN